MYVLVIDDDPMICKMAKFLLTEEGYEVDVTSTGEDAVAMIERRRPDLFILDLVLPDVDGFQIYRHLQGSRADAGILFLTPQGWLDDSATGLQLRLGAFLCKPFSAEEFITAVHSLASRCGSSPQKVSPDRLRVGSVELRAKNDRLVIRNGNLFRLMNLSRFEASLLHCLMLNTGSVVPEELLREGITEGGFPEDGRDVVDAILGGLLARMGSADDSAAYIESCGGGYRFNAVGSWEEQVLEEPVALQEAAGDQDDRVASRTCDATTRSSVGATVLRSINNDSCSMRATTGGSIRRKRAAISPALGCPAAGETTTTRDTSVSPGSEPPPTVESPGATPAFRPL